jgi:hypothetical protein
MRLRLVDEWDGEEAMNLSQGRVTQEGHLGATVDNNDVDSDLKIGLVVQDRFQHRVYLGERVLQDSGLSGHRPLRQIIPPE